MAVFNFPMEIFCYCLSLERLGNHQDIGFCMAYLKYLSFSSCRLVKGAFLLPEKKIYITKNCVFLFSYQWMSWRGTCNQNVPTTSDVSRWDVSFNLPFFYMKFLVYWAKNKARPSLRVYWYELIHVWKSSGMEHQCFLNVQG